MSPTGVGLGLRWEFLDELLEGLPPGIDFLEVSPENYMQRGGYYADALDRIRATWPIVTHGLTMSIGGVDPLDASYLEELSRFVRRVESPWHSDHLCFGSVEGRIFHDLLPVRFTEAHVGHVADRLKRAQDALGVPLAIENVSFYLHPGKKEMGEAEFIARVLEASGCGLMLDVNNAYVNATNQGFDVDAWMATVPLDRVVQMHVAGHHWFDEEGNDLPAPKAESDVHALKVKGLIVDTHGADVCDPVLALLERVLRKTGPVPVLLERDQEIPPLPRLLEELATLRVIWERATAAASPRWPSGGARSKEHAALPQVGE